MIQTIKSFNFELSLKLFRLYATLLSVELVEMFCHKFKFEGGGVVMLPTVYHDDFIDDSLIQTLKYYLIYYILLYFIYFTLFFI